MGGERNIREAHFITATAELPALMKANSQEPSNGLSPTQEAKLENKIGIGVYSVICQSNIQT